MCVVPVSILYRYLFNICQNIINWSGFFHTSFFLSPRCYTKLGYAMTRRILYQYQWGERNMFNCGDKHYIHQFLTIVHEVALTLKYSTPVFLCKSSRDKYSGGFLWCSRRWSLVSSSMYHAWTIFRWYFSCFHFTNICWLILFDFDWHWRLTIKLFDTDW